MILPTIILPLSLLLSSLTLSVKRWRVVGVISVIVVVYADTNMQAENVDDRVPIIDLSSWTSTTTSGSIHSMEQPSSSSSSPPLSLSSEQNEIIDQIRYACEHIGFFVIQNHGFDETVMSESFEASKQFFDLPTEEKLRHKSWNESQYPYGYEQSETLVKGRQLDDHDDDDNNNKDLNSSSNDNDDDDNTVPLQDLKETYAIGPNNPASGMPPRQFLNSTTESAASSSSSSFFQNSIETYYEHMERLAMMLLEIFAIALDEPPDFFVDKMDKHQCALRLIHYYPLEQPKHTQHVVRAGSHSDYGALTILAARDKGLEVLLRSSSSSDISDIVSSSNSSSNSSRKQWFAVPVIPNTLIINLGDLMQRWTNDRWVSTLHRVAMPSTDALEERYSIAFFVNVNGDTLIEPLRSCRGGGHDNNSGNDVVKYQTITAGEHLMAKHLASMSADSESSELDGSEAAVGMQDEL
jgi:isopenicillin N synthase-like dioxygenase